MSRRLKTHVHVDGQVFGPDDEVPAEFAAKIGDHAWDGPAEAVRAEPPAAPAESRDVPESRVAKVPANKGRAASNKAAESE